jgi:glycosyltransferase involved in cell wall biosynthesis
MSTIVRSFEIEHGPEVPRILFVGRADSSHVREWIGLFDDAPFDVRLFSVPNSPPPSPDWRIPTYVSSPRHGGGDPHTRRFLVSRGQHLARLQRVYGTVAAGGYRAYAQRWLQQIIATWRPHIVHTLGLRAAGLFFHEAMRERLPIDGATWVLQLWGGADLEIERPDPEHIRAASEALRASDQLFDDNPQGVDFARAIGVRDAQIAPLGIVPGAGGIDLDAIGGLARMSPSDRRTIIWPKAYETPWNKSLPVIEALKIAWDRIGQFDVEILAVGPETRAWLRALPEPMREHFHVRDRLPREEVLALMSHSRVMLAPSLIDGLPNVLLEAMATGALPLVSPLAGIRSVAEDERHALFARNLYPEEIAAAIVRAMTDDDLVERVAAANHERVAEVADRAEIRRRITEYYRGLASRQAARGNTQSTIA